MFVGFCKYRQNNRIRVCEFLQLLLKLYLYMGQGDWRLYADLSHSR